MYKIEVIGMRKRKKRIALITVIILIIIAILLCLGIHFKNKKRTIEVSTTEISETKGLNSGSSIDTGNNNNGNIQGQQTNIGQSSVSPETNNNNNNVENQTIQTITPEQTQTQTQEQNQVTSEDNNINKFIDSVDNIYNGTEGKRVFLTFDDGPSEEVTPRILDILKKYNIKATFFVLGNRVEANPDLVRREYEEGHYIANHGYSHKYQELYKNLDSILCEYNKTENTIRNALGNPNYSSHLFRFPGGSRGGPYEKVKSKARTELRKSGIAYLDWSALTYDAEGADSKKEILNNLKTTMNGWDNVVILMHDAADKKITYETLEDIIKYLQGKGYKFENIYNLMEE